jgi:ABC-type dipeptide/oligopeptide/nickel transport system permease subunit
MKRLVLVICLISVSSFLWLDPLSIEQNTKQALQGPSQNFVLGTDSLGRSYAQRLLVGIRTSLVIVSTATLVSLILALGVAQKLSNPNSWTREFLSRAVDILQGIPNLLLVLLFMALSDSNSPFVLAGLMGIFNWAGMARIFEAELVKLRAEPFLEASRSLGASPMQIFCFHGWPALRNTLVLALLVHIPGQILFESSLSFLGFGVQPPNTSLGSLISEAWPHLSTSPHLLLFPGLLLFGFSLSVRTPKDPSHHQTLNLKNKTSPSLTW